MLLVVTYRHDFRCSLRSSPTSGVGAWAHFPEQRLFIEPSGHLKVYIYQPSSIYTFIGENGKVMFQIKNFYFTIHVDNTISHYFYI